MASEISALEANHTWDLRPLPPGTKALGCKCVYKIKYHADGSVERFKARLVVLGNHQVEGEDFHETFAPVAKMVTVRTLLTLAGAKGWSLHQMNIHNAFLHGDLREDIYMKVPPGFQTPQPNMVCKLRKSLYGLRQAPRQWFSKLTSALRDYGFQQSPFDHSLFTYDCKGIFLVLLIYVDDLVLTGNDTHQCVDFKHYLHRCFKLKDLGPLKIFSALRWLAHLLDYFFVSGNIRWIFSPRPECWDLSPIRSRWNNNISFPRRRAILFPLLTNIDA